MREVNGIGIRRIISFAAAVAIASLSLYTAINEAETAPTVIIPKQTVLASRGGGPAQKPPEPRIIYEGIAEITAYTAQDDPGMDGRGITASGAPAQAWVSVAAWPGVPFGAVVEVPALGKDGMPAKFIVHDRGEAITYGHIDIFVGHTNKAEAFEFGRQKLQVKIYAP